MKRLTTGRLFRKYVAVLILLVGGMLLLSSVVNLYFSYRQTKAALIDLQRQQAHRDRLGTEADARQIFQHIAGRQERTQGDGVEVHLDASELW